MKILKQAIYSRYVIAEVSKYIQISLQTSSDSFLQSFQCSSFKIVLGIQPRNHPQTQNLTLTLSSGFF